MFLSPWRSCHWWFDDSGQLILHKLQVGVDLRGLSAGYWRSEYLQLWFISILLYLFDLTFKFHFFIIYLRTSIHDYFLCLVMILLWHRLDSAHLLLTFHVFIHLFQVLIWRWHQHYFEGLPKTHILTYLKSTLIFQQLLQSFADFYFSWTFNLVQDFLINQAIWEHFQLK